MGLTLETGKELATLRRSTTTCAVSLDWLRHRDMGVAKVQRES